MAKRYKIRNKNIDEEIVEDIDDSGLSKKEIYDLNKKKKELSKNKDKNKTSKKNSKKNGNKTYQTNLAGRIFAIVMLILMVGSVIATIASYIR